jgi:hypothetical protein
MFAIPAATYASVAMMSKVCTLHSCVDVRIQEGERWYLHRVCVECDHHLCPPSKLCKDLQE